jgi:hypothetical protein
MTFDEELELCRLEGLAAQARARAACPPLSALLDEFRRRHAEELAERREAVRLLLGAPPEGGLSRATPGPSSLRNVRFK